MLTHETNPELPLLQVLGVLSRVDYEFKFAPAVRQTILDLSQKEEAEEILKLSPSYDDEARQVIFNHGDELEVRIETRLLEYWTDYGCLQLLKQSATIEMFVLTRPFRRGIMNT